MELILYRVFVILWLITNFILFVATNDHEASHQFEFGGFLYIGVRLDLFEFWCTFSFKVRDCHGC
jgi:hypothetical protein